MNCEDSSFVGLSNAKLLCSTKNHLRVAGMAEQQLVAVECENCNVDTCKSLHRIEEILSKYHQWLVNTNNKDASHQKNIAEFMEDLSISTKSILKDYKHIKQNNYNLASDNLLCTQSLTKCISLERHKRDNYQQYESLYGTSDIKQILLQQLFDKIHLFIYHPFDANRRKEESHDHHLQRFGTNVDPDTDTEDDGNDVEQEVEQEEEKYDHVVFDDEIAEEEEKKEVESMMSAKDLERDSYNFGQQFFYWDAFKNHAWYIIKKYDDFKEELLENDVYRVDPYYFNLEYQRALELLTEDETVTAMRSNGEFKDKYGIKEGEVITMNHILAILFYCNTNELQRAFSATYRRRHDIDGRENDFDLKLRHQNYWHFGKYLREMVEVYGKVLLDKEKDKNGVEKDLILYHGLDQPLYFKKMIAKFFGPTSTTKDRMVAARFAGMFLMLLRFVFLYIPRVHVFYMFCI